MEEEPLFVEPLAVAIPQELPLNRLKELVPVTEVQLSKWVLNKMKGFWKYVGASYEGYTDKVIELLCAIDARRCQTGEATIKRMPNYSGLKGNRELRGLISSINYSR
jgi:hypothetical protein